MHEAGLNLLYNLNNCRGINSLDFDWDLSKFTGHSKHACTLMEGEIQKTAFCKRTCWSCVWKRKKYFWTYIGFSIYWIKYCSYIFYECFITASYPQKILFLRKPFLFPLEGICALFLLQYPVFCSLGLHENSALLLVECSCDSPGKAQKGLTVVFPTNRPSTSRLKWKLVHYKMRMSWWERHPFVLNKLRACVWCGSCQAGTITAEICGEY